MEKQLSLSEDSCQSPQPSISDKSSTELFDIVGNLPEDILGEVIVYLAEKNDLQKLISWQTVSTQTRSCGPHLHVMSRMNDALTDCAIRFQKDGACFSTTRRPRFIIKRCSGVRFFGTCSPQLTTALAGLVMSLRFPTPPSVGRYEHTWP